MNNVENQRSLKQEYLRQSVMTATPSELLVMLFDACIRNLKMAGVALEEPACYMKANEYFINAQKIISELIATLDMQFELSTQLLPIYEFLLRTIRQMNVRKDTSDLPSVIEILTAQRDTWEQVSRMPNGKESRQICI